jgi:dolichol-phosphate mannosyltransferase
MPSGNATLELNSAALRSARPAETPNKPLAELEILLPVHNEAASIEKTMQDIYQEISSKVSVRFIVCEDGSKDDTREVLARLEKQLPGRYITSAQRKGYSKAVKDGMATVSSPYLLCLDGDGQCDPKDFWAFWNARNDADIVIGWRTKRSDPLFRRVLSGFFYLAYQLIYRAPIHDPSCPFILVKREVVESLLPQIGSMREGYWWEFTARAQRAGFSMKEFPVHHRERAAGKTQVYRLNKLAGIGARHFAALVSIWFQTRSGRVRP